MHLAVSTHCRQLISLSRATISRSRSHSLTTLALARTRPAAMSNPPAAAAAVASSLVFPAPLLDPLLAMGFSLGRAQRGLQATGACSVEAAMMWAIEHAEDEGVDEPLRVGGPPAGAAAAADTPVVAAASTGGAVASVDSSSSSSSAAGPVRFSSFPPDAPFKLVLVVRTDLHMRTGKIAAQTAHAAVGTVMDLQERAARHQRNAAHAAANPDALGSVLGDNSARALHSWLDQGQAKVVLQVGSRAEMHTLEARARARGIATHIVADAGRTQIAAGSETVLAVGPAPIELVNEITGHLKLL